MANQYRSVLASSGPAPTGGNALPAEVLSGKTFTNDNGAQTGTMPNRGAVSETLTAGQIYTVPEGYHNGEGTVTVSGYSLPKDKILADNPNDATKSGLFTMSRGVAINISSYPSILFNIEDASSVQFTGSNFGSVIVSTDGTTRTMGSAGGAINSGEVLMLINCLDTTSRTITINN